MTTSYQMMLPFEGKRKAVAPKEIRRCVRRERLDPLPDGTYLFRARSFTRQRGQIYRCRVNPATGYVWCNCRDFMYRRGPEHPTYGSGPLCKHLRRAVKTVRKAERERGVAVADAVTMI